MNENDESRVVVSLLRLSSTMRKDRRLGGSFVESIASAAANHGTDYALGFLYGAYYSGILNRDIILRSDFQKAVSFFGLEWDDFCSRG
jgi:hypothetical protein